MADLAITNTFVANTLARASEVNTNFNDVKNFINAHNQGTTGWDQITLASSGLLSLPINGTAGAPSLTFTGDTDTGFYYIASNTLGLTTAGVERVRLSSSSLQSALALTLTPTSNQLVLGTTNTTTISATAPAASRVYTLPDVLGAADFIMSAGTQTINGSKTFGSAINAPSENLTNTTNQLVLGTTNTYTINATAPATSRVITLADPGAAASFVMTEGSQTINGSKTFGSTITAPAATLSNTTNQLVLGVTNTTTINSTAPAASRTYTIPDSGGTASFVMTAGNQTIAGNKTFSGTTEFSDGTVSTPSITFTGDTNTGIFHAGADDLQLTVNGAIGIRLVASTTILSVAGTNIAQAVATAFQPNSDNAVSCGASGQRWTAVHAANGTIQTSMANTKENIVELAPEECSVPKPITFNRPGESVAAKRLGWLADELPIEAHPLVEDANGNKLRDPDNVYTDAVIAQLCLAARNDYKRIQELEQRLAVLEAQ